LNRIDKDKGTISLLYKLVGEGTELMAELETGDLLDVLGPLGNTFSIEEDCGDSIFVAGGIGVAPFYPLARLLLQLGQKVTCIMGARCREDINELDELRALGVNVLCATEDGSEGMRGLVTDVLRAHLRSTKCSMAYACGPNPMLAAVKAVCAEHQTPLQLSLESHMACGIGVCLGCTCKKGPEEGYVHVCKEGPIFWAEEVAL
jgi:dihydroorotate dehydrogenase electron transfer subunit